MAAAARSYAADRSLRYLGSYRMYAVARKNEWPREQIFSHRDALN
jgi:hypothetical protein